MEFQKNISEQSKEFQKDDAYYIEYFSPQEIIPRNSIVSAILNYKKPKDLKESLSNLKNIIPSIHQQFKKIVYVFNDKQVSKLENLSLNKLKKEDIEIKIYSTNNTIPNAIPINNFKNIIL